MELLFTLDEKNYTDDMPVVERFAVRGLICRNGKYVMQKSGKGDYKIPGGGMEKGETKEQALAREVQEETGLIIKPDSIRFIGEAQELRRDCFDASKKYIAHSYFFFCDAEEETVETAMTVNEIKLGYEPAWETLDEILRVNKLFQKAFWQERDNKFLQMLLDHKFDDLM